MKSLDSVKVVKAYNMLKAFGTGLGISIVNKIIKHQPICQSDLVTKCKTDQTYLSRKIKEINEGLPLIEKYKDDSNKKFTYYSVDPAIVNKINNATAILAQ